MNLWNTIATVMDALMVCFLSYKAFSYLFRGEDTIGVLFVCATALWCISCTLYNIRLDNLTNLKESTHE